MTPLQAWLRKDGWILAAILFCVALCLMMGQQDAASTDEEGRISRVLSAIQGAGTVDIAVYYEADVPCGAVVVAEGAGDIAVQLRLMSAVTTLLGVEPDRVSIFAREGQP